MEQREKIKMVLYQNISFHDEEFGDSGQIPIMDFDIDEAADEIAKLIEQEYEPVELEPLTEEEVKKILKKYWVGVDTNIIRELLQATIAKNSKEQFFRLKK